MKDSFLTLNFNGPRSNRGTRVHHPLEKHARNIDKGIRGIGERARGLSRVLRVLYVPRHFSSSSSFAPSFLSPFTRDIHTLFSVASKSRS